MSGCLVSCSWFSCCFSCPLVVFSPPLVSGGSLVAPAAVWFHRLTFSPVLCLTEALMAKTETRKRRILEKGANLPLGAWNFPVSEGGFLDDPHQTAFFP